MAADTSSSPGGSTRDPGEGRFTIAAPGAGVSAVIATFGAALVSLVTPDRDGRPADVCLGFDTTDGYRTHRSSYLGCTVGRVTNRIADARFRLDGVEHRLAANDGPNHLHGGGPAAFGSVEWELVAADARSVTLRHVSPHGEEGYPGRVEATVRYALSASGELTIELTAVTDRRTPVSLTNHAYWNLAGEGSGDVLGHELTVDADRWVPNRPGGIPTGAVVPVEGTPYDLRRPTVLRVPMTALAGSPAGGIDDNLVLRVDRDPDAPAAVLRDPGSGRRLELRTDAPCLQVYTGNMLADLPGKDGHRYRRYGGICLEPQVAPDAVNQPVLDALGRSVFLEPGERYRRTIALRPAAD